MNSITLSATANESIRQSGERTANGVMPGLRTSTILRPCTDHREPSQSRLDAEEEAHRAPGLPQLQLQLFGPGGAHLLNHRASQLGLQRSGHVSQLARSQRHGWSEPAQKSETARRSAEPSVSPGGE